MALNISAWSIRNPLPSILFSLILLILGLMSFSKLAVTRLPPGDVCHVAYVDVAANPNANELARQAADGFARDFQCGTDQVKAVGESGRTTALTRR